MPPKRLHAGGTSLKKGMLALPLQVPASGISREHYAGT